MGSCQGKKMAMHTAGAASFGLSEVLTSLQSWTLGHDRADTMSSSPA
jgi:hypothetical protein